MSGLDGAAQAGMILAQVCRLPDEHHNVIVARYGRVMQWRAAIDALSHYPELAGIHNKARLIIVERAVCGGKLEGDKLSKQYSHSKTALYKQLSLVKDKFRRIERLAINELDNAFFE